MITAPRMIRTLGAFDCFFAGAGADWFQPPGWGAPPGCGPGWFQPPPGGGARFPVACRLDGRVFAQVAGILHALGPDLGLVPQDETARLQALQLQLTIADLVTEIHDSHHPIASAEYYEDQTDAARRRAADLRAQRLPKFLGYFETVLAAGDGVVTFVGSVAGTPVVAVDHAGGIRTTYQPVRSGLKLGDDVLEGQDIGALAHAPAGFSGSHVGLHWGALIAKDTYIDPLTLLEPPRIRLKPLVPDATPADAPGRTRA